MAAAGTVSPRRAGRPPKPPEERLTNVVQLRMSDADLDACYRSARRNGESLSDYFRRLARAEQKTWDSVVPKDANGAGACTLRGNR